MEAMTRDSSGNAAVVRIDTRNALGTGATALVCQVESAGYDGSLAKIYRDLSTPEEAQFRECKLRAMLENPPTGLYGDVAGAMRPQYAWPTALLHDTGGRLLGYLMPRVDEKLSLTLDYFYDRYLASRGRAAGVASLPARLTIGRNIAGLLADLHAHRHCFIDFKPQNVKVYRDSRTVAMLDCDGYRITGKAMQVFPASNFSSEYIAPEALRGQLGPGSLSEGQDRFALAVVLFQLLNNGIHPYQGIQVDGADVPSTDDKVREGLYAYGLAGNAAIKPVRLSIHGCFDAATRALFDRAFDATSSLGRPTAREWRDHLTGFLTQRRLERCAAHPNERTHIRFPGMDCGTCLFERELDKARKPSKPTMVPKRSKPSKPSRSSPGTTVSPGKPSIPAFVYWIVAIIALIVIVNLLSGGGAGTQTQNPAEVTVARVNDRFTRVVLRTEPAVRPQNRICCVAPGTLVREIPGPGLSRVRDESRDVTYAQVEITLADGRIRGWISARAIDSVRVAGTVAGAPQACHDASSAYCKER